MAAASSSPEDESEALDSGPPLEELLKQEWLTIAQVARLQNVKYRTARSWVANGWLEASTFNRQVRISPDQLRAFLLRRSKDYKPNPDPRLKVQLPE